MECALLAAAGFGSIENESVPSYFEQIVQSHSERIAIGSGTWRASFGELNAAANKLGRCLMTLPGARGDRVVFLMRHDGPLIAAMLGALKAGRVGVVLNPSDPEARLRQALQDADPACIVADSAHRSLAKRVAVAGLAVMDYESAGCESDENLRLAIGPHELAFLVYTSGSTGHAKAVMIPHSQVLHNARRLAVGLGLSPEDRSVWLASPSGGQGLATLWSALLSGGGICPFPIMERGVTGLADWLEDHGITIWVSAASIFRHFVQTLEADRRIARVRVVRLGSEIAIWDDAAAWRRHFGDDGILMHTYSSSETGNVTQFRVTAETPIVEGRLPVGPAVDGVELFLLNESGNEVLREGEGEIVVRSRFLSTGYWRRENLTAAKFLGGEGPNESRTFRTGDLARWNDRGELVVCGRADKRVKVHGYRIETSEIELAIGLVAGVERAVVRVRSERDGHCSLRAYISRRAGVALTAESIRGALRDSLPGHMIPAEFLFLDNFPITPHGKIDGGALDRMEARAEGAPLHVAPITSTEAMIAGIWESVLKRSAVGRGSNFFDLGGDSLSAAVIAARIYAASGVQLDLKVFIDYAVLSEFALAVERLAESPRSEDSVPLRRVPRDSPLPLSFAQERIWRISQSPDHSATYTVASKHQIAGALEIEAFRRSMNIVARRHEILWTTFESLGGVPVQRVHPARHLSIPILDVSDQDNPEERATEILRREARRPFDLKRLPLLRVLLVRINPTEYRLLRVSHHIISDAWSWRIFFEDVAKTYESEIRGTNPATMDAHPLHYADFASWQRQRLHRQGDMYRSSVAWWKIRLAEKVRPLELPRRTGASHFHAKPEDGLIWWGLDEQISRRLETLARARNATYFGVRLAAFMIHLARESRNNDVVLGMYATNRTRLETQRMFGFFANLTTLRMKLEPGRSFSYWLDETQRLVGETHSNGEIPYEELCDELRRAGIEPPEIRAIFGMSDHRADLQLGTAKFSWIDRRVESMPWGFSLSFDQHHERNRCSVMFDACLYDPAWVREFVGRYIKLLEDVSLNPDVPVELSATLGIGAESEPSVRIP